MQKLLNITNSEKPGFFEDYVLWRISYLYLWCSCTSDKKLDALKIMVMPIIDTKLQ